MTSQRAFNPVAQLRWGGCQPYLPWVPKVAESPGSGPAPPLHCSPIASSQNLPLWFPAVSRACFLSISACDVPHLEQTFTYCPPAIPPLIQEPVPALFTNSHQFQSTSCCFSSEEEPIAFFLPLEFLNVCPKLVIFFCLFLMASTHLPVGLGAAEQTVHGLTPGTQQTGWTDISFLTQLLWDVLASVQAISCSTWKFQYTAVKAMGNVMQH